MRHLSTHADTHTSARTLVSMMAARTLSPIFSLSPFLMCAAAEKGQRAAAGHDGPPQVV